MQFPVDGPPVGQPYEVAPFGAAYVEFSPTAFVTRTADLTVTVTLIVNPAMGESNPKVSIIPITNFGATAPNNFITPVIVPEDTYYIYRYTQTIPNFQQLNRVTVIISSVDNTYPFAYHADVIIR